MSDQLKAFYASPFSEEFKWIRDSVAAACREHDVELRAVDEVVIPGGNIVQTIHQEIDECDFAFAVLTESNPNVFYELGRLLQASKPTVLLISRKQLSALPFDVRSFSVLSYESQEEREELTASVGSSIGKVRLALDPTTRSKSIKAQALDAKTLIVTNIDFEKVRIEAQKMLGAGDCDTVDVKSFDTSTFKGWNQTLECPNGDTIVIVIDLNGDIVRAKKK